MAHSAMDITPHTLSFGSHVVQTRNIATATIVEDEARGNFRGGLFFFCVVAVLIGGFIGFIGVMDGLDGAAGASFVWRNGAWRNRALVFLLLGAVLGFWAYKIGPKWNLVLSTADAKVTALASTDYNFIWHVLHYVKAAMTTQGTGFAYHVNVDKLQIVDGNNVNVYNSPGSKVAGGSIK